MKIHEYQAKEFFTQYGIPTADGIVCRNAMACADAYKELHSPKVVIKAQVLTGGRGKAGGVKLASGEDQVVEVASSILGMDIKGYKVDRVMVAKAVNIESEYYISLVVDRNTKSVVLIMSKEGGMDIEEVAAKTPEKIFRIPIDPFTGIPNFLAARAARLLFDNESIVKQAIPVIQKMYKLFTEKDASLVEINPMVVTKEGSLLAIDGKMNFDDNALYRQPLVESLFEPNAEEKTEQMAKSKGFSFVHLGGKIGCMVNGAGLAMSTMDTIKLYGGRPANFLDIGGSSNPNKVIEAMKLLLADTSVKVVLINIFGGITRCDDVARGLLEAFKEIETNIPVVIRLTGTNHKEGLDLLKDSAFHSASTMGQAVQKAVELSK